MNQIVKGFLGTFLLLMLTVVGTESLRGYFQVLYAQNVQSQVINEIENSHYNAEVIKACLNRAKEKDYSLKVSLYDERGNQFQYSTDRTPNFNGFRGTKIKNGEVELGFHYQFNFYNMDKEQVLRGYVR